STFLTIANGTSRGRLGKRSSARTGVSDASKQTVVSSQRMGPPGSKAGSRRQFVGRSRDYTADCASASTESRSPRFRPYCDVRDERRLDYAYRLEVCP